MAVHSFVFPLCEVRQSGRGTFIADTQFTKDCSVQRPASPFFKHRFILYGLMISVPLVSLLILNQDLIRGTCPILTEKKHSIPNIVTHPSKQMQTGKTPRSPHLKHHNLAPENVEPSPAGGRLYRRFRVLICNVEEMADRNIFQRDDFRLPDELVPEVEEEDNGDVDIGRDESFRVPAAELGVLVTLFQATRVCLRGEGSGLGGTYWP
jgi:RNA recognition motif-containing protein